MERNMDEPSKKIINHGPNHTIRTILCDSGMRHLSYLWFSILLSILSGCRLFFILRQVSCVKD